MPASAGRKTARHLLWVLPLLTCLAGYGYGRVARPAAAPAIAAASRTTPNLRSAPFTGDPAVLFAQTLATLDRPESAAGPPSVTGLNPAALKQRLLDLLARHGHLNNPDPWAPPDPSRAEFYALAEELGRQQGAAGVAWIGEHLPELRLAAIDAWAKQDPAAAFAVISASEDLNPCSRDTLMELLDKQGEAGSDALLAAIDRVPWHLFTTNDGLDPFALPGLSAVSFGLQPSADIRLWAESGALRHLAEEGIWTPGALGSLARIDAPLAMTEWSARPPTNDALQSAIDLREILTQASTDEAQTASLQKLLTTPGGYADDPHFQKILTKAISGNSGLLDFLHEKFPGIAPETTTGDKP